MMKTITRNTMAGAALIALVAMPGQLLARSKSVPVPITVTRKVVLMEFGQPAPDLASAVPLSADLATGPGGMGGTGEPGGATGVVGDQMANVFINSARSAPAVIDQTNPQSPAVPAMSASALPNPFITRAVGFVPLPASYAGAPCNEAVYQPDYSHGRSAEDRRRIIYPLMQQVACEQGLPLGLFDALIMQESGYNHAAISRKGALGITQLMPGTARHLGANPYALMENLRGGARYLRQQIERFGRYDLALAAYNAGPERVARYGRVPAIAETMGYVRNISASWGHGVQPKLASIALPSGRRAQLIFMSYAEQANVDVRAR